MAKRAPSAKKKRPLSGRRIVVTRARSQAAVFTRTLETLGADPIEFPTIEIAPPASYEGMDDAINKLDTYDWIIFTSVNGVDFFSSRLKRLERALPGEIRSAAIGPETAKAVKGLGLAPELVPEEYRAESILDKLRPEEMRGRRVLVPRAAEARDVLIRTLQLWRAQVDVVEAYRTVMATSDPAPLRKMLLDGEVDMVTFTSSSTVRNFKRFFAEDDLKQLMSRTAVASIGPVTQGTAEEIGLRGDVVAEEYTIEGLTEAIVEYFKKATGKRH